MKRKIVAAAVLLAAGVLVPASGSANPILADMTNACQVPGHAHAQISFMTLDPPDFAAGDLSLVRNGMLVSSSWVEGSVTENGGSGLDSYKAFQACDCNVAPGKYDYVILFPGGSRYAGAELNDLTLDISAIEDVQTARQPLEVVSSPDAAPQDAGDEPDEMMPWEIPSPPWPKGLDCVQWCADHPRTEGDGGCSVSPGNARPAASSAAAALLLLLALGSLLALLRRPVTR
jgi:hypothetical protein